MLALSPLRSIGKGLLASKLLEQSACSAHCRATSPRCRSHPGICGARVIQVLVASTTWHPEIYVVEADRGAAQTGVQNLLYTNEAPLLGRIPLLAPTASLFPTSKQGSATAIPTSHKPTLALENIGWCTDPLSYLKLLEQTSCIRFCSQPGVHCPADSRHRLYPTTRSIRNSRPALHCGDPIHKSSTHPALPVLSRRSFQIGQRKFCFSSLAHGSSIGAIGGAPPLNKKSSPPVSRASPILSQTLCRPHHSCRLRAAANIRRVQCMLGTVPGIAQETISCCPT